MSYDIYLAFERAVQKLPHTGPLTALRHEPVAGALPNRCFENVRQQVAQHGGEVQYGWMFSAFCEEPYVAASGHAVWLKDGELIDITPRRYFARVPQKSMPMLDRNGLLVFLPHSDGPTGRRFVPLTRQKNVVKWCRKSRPRRESRILAAYTSLSPSSCASRAAHRSSMASISGWRLSSFIIASMLFSSKEGEGTSMTCWDGFASPNGAS
jgi:hypothetical protein